MRTKLPRYVVLSFLFFSASVSGQKTIILNESLNTTADQFKVKLGSQGLGKMWKIRFGDYSVVSSTSGWTKTTNKSNFSGTKSETKSSDKFSFDLRNGPDIVTVDASNEINVNSLNEIEIFPNFTWGNDEVTERTDKFLALIYINKDTSERWALLMNSKYDAAAGNKFEGTITNGTRKIILHAASSRREGESSRSLPALGYQFVENNEYLGAVQYYGGGTLGFNKNVVWIDKELDQKLKLVIAAAATSILQIKVTMPTSEIEL